MNEPTEKTVLGISRARLTAENSDRVQKYTSVALHSNVFYV